MDRFLVLCIALLSATVLVAVISGDTGAGLSTVRSMMV